MEGNTFSNGKEIKRELTAYFKDGVDFKLHLLRLFGTYQKASLVAGIDESRIHQIASGYKVPMNPDKVKRLAEVWFIDPVLLSALFEKLRTQKEQNTPVSSGVEPSNSTEVKDG